MKIKNVPSDLLITSVWTVMTFIFVTTPALENSIIRTILGLHMAPETKKLIFILSKDQAGNYLIGI